MLNWTGRTVPLLRVAFLHRGLRFCSISTVSQNRIGNDGHQRNSTDSLWSSMVSSSSQCSLESLKVASFHVPRSIFLEKFQMYDAISKRFGFNALPGEIRERVLPSRLPPSAWIPVVPTVATITDPETTYRPSMPISCPLMEKKHEIRATNRVKRQRWRHCRNKNRKQRMKKFRHVIMKNQDEREAVKEAQFRKEMSVMLKNALAFDPDHYVRNTIARTKWQPTPDNTEKLRSRIFWSEFMTVEQLFGVPDGDFINKRDGFAAEEDWNKILELRQKYNSEYKKKK